MKRENINLNQQTRSQYLEGKSEVSDEDIIRILDLPHEKPSNRELPVFTDKAFLELKEYPEELNKLVSRLKLEPEYLKYRSTYIAKSKLLFQESRVLYNEIPALMILDEINEPAYLLPYLYSRKGNDEKSFADSILENDSAFTDFKRVFSEDFSRDFKKGKNQGSAVFIFLNHKKFDKQNVFHRLKRKVKASNSKNKTYKAYFYSEQEKELFGYSIDKIGFIKELDITQVKKSGLTPLGKPSGAEAISNMISTTSTGLNINRVYKFVNNSFFYSLLERGAITEFSRNSNIKNRNERYLISLINLESVTNRLSDGVLKSSNLSFIKAQKDSPYYKDLIRKKERNVALIERLEGKKTTPDHDLLYKQASIVVNGRNHVCRTGLLNGFKNCVTQLDEKIKQNKELLKENEKLRNLLDNSNDISY